MDYKFGEIIEEIADGLGHPKDVNNEEQQTQGEMPTASADMDDEALLEEAPIGGTDARIRTRGTRGIYIRTADRFRREKRQGDPDRF